MFNLIETLSSYYLAADTREDGNKLILSGAIKVSDDQVAQSTQALAKDYVVASIQGELKGYKLSEANIHSVEEQEELSTVIGALQTLVPLAEKRAKRNAILAEFHALAPSEAEDEAYEAEEEEEADED